MEHDLGWRDPVKVLLALQVTVQTICMGKDNFRTRMQKATFALVDLTPEYFPTRIHNTARLVLSLRGRVPRQNANNCDTIFYFDKLKPKERAEFIFDILSLYEACLIDVGKLGYDFLYPKDKLRTVVDDLP
jgi:hypothetical protein